MPARKRPTPQDAATARRILLDRLARNSDVSELAGELAPLHPRNDTFPGEVFLHLAADALDWCGASRAAPLALEGMRDRFLPECAFRGRQHHKLQFAILAAAARRRAKIVLFDAQEGGQGQSCAPLVLDVWRSAGTAARSPPGTRAGWGQPGVKGLGREVGGLPWRPGVRWAAERFGATAVASVGGEPAVVAGDCP